MAARRGFAVWLAGRPWLWLVLLVLAMLLADVALVWIAGREPPVDVGP